MLIALQEKAIQKMLKAHGFKSWDSELVQHINEAFYNFIYNELKSNGMRHNKQSGGKIVMPLEYFGVESNNFVEAADGVSVAPTAEYVRPPIASTFQSAGAGSGSFSFTKASVAMVVEDVANKYNKSVENKQSVVTTMKTRAEKKFSDVLRAVMKKTKNDHMSLSEWKAVTTMKKHKSLN